MIKSAVLAVLGLLMIPVWLLVLGCLMATMLVVCAYEGLFMKKEVAQ